MRRPPAFRRPLALVALGVALGLSACADTEPPASEPSTDSPDAAAEAAGFAAPVPALMGLLTGQAFDAARGCWPVEVDGDGSRRSLCLRPGTPATRPQDGRDRVFLHAFAWPDATPGRGVFAAIVAEPAADGRWQVVSRLRGMAVGDDGDCGCAQADLRRMGRNRWGWVFAAREGGQRSYRVVMSSSAGLAEAARVVVPEDGTDGLRHRVEFDIRDENAEAFALLHVVLRGVQPVDVRTHPFDTGLGRYAASPATPGD